MYYIGVNDSAYGIKGRLMFRNIDICTGVYS